MLQQLWQKTVTVRVTYYPEDLASDVPPLPLYLEAAYHHYFGIYLQQIQEFFHRYICYPIDPDETWLELAENQREIKSTDIIYNIFALHPPKQSVLDLVIHFRREMPVPKVDLLEYYKQQIKASTCIKDRKQGARVLLSQLTTEQFNNLYSSFEGNYFETFMGDEDPESGKLGYRRVAIKMDYVPVVVLAGTERVTRKFEPTATLSQVRKSLGGTQQDLYLLGTKLKGDPCLEELVRYCHPDGNLYVCIRS